MKLSVKLFTGAEKLPDLEYNEKDQEFIDFIKEDALSLQNQKICKVYMFNNGEKNIGYCALSMDSIKSLFFEEKIHTRFKIPALKIGRLFVHKDFRGNGYGTEMISWCISKAYKVSRIFGCRFVIVDAIKDKVNWYKKRGFEVIPEQESQTKENYKMFFDLEVLKN